MSAGEVAPTASSVAVRLRAAVDAAETGGWLTTGREMTALLRDALRVIEGQAAPGQEVRREWRVLWRVGESSGVSGPYFAQYLAERAVVGVRQDVRGCTVEIEEREITTRVVERRVVPRTTTGEGA